MQLPAISLSTARPAKTSSAANNTNSPVLTSSQTSKSQDTQSTETQANSKTRQANTPELSETDYRVIAELKKIDRGVRAHEAAHMAAAGGLVRGGASYTYTKGPDGQRYAVGGEVSIDTSPERDDPEATILKAQRIQAAALAPAQPSDADRAVAAGAAQMATAARAELAAEQYRTDEPKKGGDDNKRITDDAVTTDNSARESNSETETRKTVPSVAEELYKTINRATAAEDTLGNLLNTAV